MMPAHQALCDWLAEDYVFNRLIVLPTTNVVSAPAEDPRRPYKSVHAADANGEILQAERSLFLFLIIIGYSYLQSQARNVGINTKTTCYSVVLSAVFPRGLVLDVWQWTTLWRPPCLIEMQ